MPVANARAAAANNAEQAQVELESCGWTEWLGRAGRLLRPVGCLGGPVYVRLPAGENQRLMLVAGPNEAARVATLLPLTLSETDVTVGDLIGLLELWGVLERTDRDRLVLCRPMPMRDTALVPVPTATIDTAPASWRLLEVLTDPDGALSDEVELGADQLAWSGPEDSLVAAMPELPRAQLLEWLCSDPAVTLADVDAAQVRVVVELGGLSWRRTQPQTP
jgi:hypothetical protein